MEKITLRDGTFVTTDDRISLSEPRLVKLLIDFKEQIDTELNFLKALLSDFQKEKSTILNYQNDESKFKPMSDETREDLTALTMEFISNNKIISDIMDLDAYRIPSFMFDDKLNIRSIFLLVWLKLGFDYSITSILHELENYARSLYLRPGADKENYILDDIFLYKNCDGHSFSDVKSLFSISSAIDIHEKFTQDLECLDFLYCGGSLVYLYKTLYQQ